VGCSVCEAQSLISHKTPHTHTHTHTHLLRVEVVHERTHAREPIGEHQSADDHAQHHIHALGVGACGEACGGV
jgi:hypothetical protein